MIPSDTHSPDLEATARATSRPDAPASRHRDERVSEHFVTRVYRGRLDAPELVAALHRSSLMVAREDRAGQRWAREHGYPGYTSYASLDDLPRRDPDIASLVRRLDRHVARFVESLDFAGVRRLRLDSLWINILRGGGGHSSHIHPHSVISGTCYLACPSGACGLRLEDPRLGLMMAAPPRATKGDPRLAPFVTLTPEPGTVFLWESWLRHEVPQSRTREDRVSISFNYA